MRYSGIRVIRIGGGGGGVDQKVVADGYPRHYNQNLSILE